MSDHTVTFDRIGRRHDVPPLDVTFASDADEVAEQIYRYARKFLGSREVEVVLEEASGSIFAGFHTASNFVIAPALVAA